MGVNHAILFNAECAVTVSNFCYQFSCYQLFMTRSVREILNCKRISLCTMVTEFIVVSEKCFETVSTMST